MLSSIRICRLVDPDREVERSGRGAGSRSDFPDVAGIARSALAALTPGQRSWRVTSTGGPLRGPVHVAVAEMLLGTLVVLGRRRFGPEQRLDPPGPRVGVDQHGLEQQGHRDRQESAERAEYPGPEQQGHERDGGRESTESPMNRGWINDWITMLSTQ